jgi:hypothetical protein
MKTQYLTRELNDIKEMDHANVWQMTKYKGVKMKP